MDESKLLFATEGKDKVTVEAFKQDLEAHNRRTEKITQASCNMSPSFISGVAQELPNAEITFDKFHVIKLLNDGVDNVRRQEVKDNKDPKGTRYLWLKNRTNLTEKQSTTFDSLSKLNVNAPRLKLVRAPPFQKLHRLGYQQARRYSYQHMHMIPIDCTRIDYHFFASRNLSQQLTTPQPHITTQYRITILRYPDQMIFTTPNSVATMFITQVSEFKMKKIGFIHSITHTPIA